MSTDTHLPPSARERALDTAASCNRFGLCISSCPTYVLTHQEAESPRGRIELIKQMFLKPGSPEPATVAHIDSCLSCLACETSCGVPVDYMHLIDTARAHIEQNYRRPWAERFKRSLVAMVLPRPWLFRLALSCAGPWKRAPRLIPRMFRSLFEFVPERLPDSSIEPAAGTYPAEGTRRARVMLLPGCAQRILAPTINASSLRLLRRAGCEVVIPPGVQCCGALTLHMGRTGAARRAAKSVVSSVLESERHGPIDAIVINAAGCGTTVKDYQELLRADSAFAEGAKRVAELAVDISQLLSRLTLPPAVAGRRLDVAYHDACSLRNRQRITREPRALLTAAGFAVRDVAEPHLCCGSAGTYNLLQAQTARQLGKRKAEHIARTNADVAVAGNIGCLTQLARYCALPLLHTVELLDWATGGPTPAAIAGSAQHRASMIPPRPTDEAMW